MLIDVETNKKYYSVNRATTLTNTSRIKLNANNNITQIITYVIFFLNTQICFSLSDDVTIFNPFIIKNITAATIHT